MAKRLRILHLSDLHMGQERGAARWRLRDVLGQAWQDNLDAIVQDGQVDLVCFTGDLAFSGKPEQYREAGEGIDFLLKKLKLGKSRFFCVPGNHDIDRDLEEDAWRNLRDAHDVRPEDFDPWIAGGRTPRGCDGAWIDAVLQRRRAYDDWLTAFGLDHLRPAHHRHGRLGYRITFAPDELGNTAPLHIVGFDSAWLAGDGDHREQDNANLRLTREQVGRLLSDDNGDPLTGHAIGLIHHPFSNLIEHESQSMPALMSRKGLGLLLHGHLHDLRLSRWSNPDHGLHISSAGSQYQCNDVPNTIHLIDVELLAGQLLRPATLWVRAWDGDGGHWYSDNKRYRHMIDGRLKLTPDAPVHDSLNLDPGIFVGRETELEQLRAALLPTAGGVPLPTVIEGMPGVGKSRLTEEFVRRHWLPAQGIAADAATTEHVLRIELRPDDTRDALSLGRALADDLQLSGTDDSLWARLREALQNGPGGRPRLLRVDNVDRPVQADVIAKLAIQLRGCPMVFTARQRGWAGAGWVSVPAQPLSLPKAVQLLQEKVREIDAQWVPRDDDAGKLASELGCLPLALHIAASHLANGMPVDEFYTHLRAQSLALKHAHPGGLGTEEEEARRVVQSSFELSWAFWCAGDGADPSLCSGLVAIAQSGIESLGDDLGALLAGLPASDYGRLLVGARRLSLLDLEAARDREDLAPRRLLRLHPLMAEFLREKPGPPANTMHARLTGWLLPKIADLDEMTMRASREAVRGEYPALQRWLAYARFDESVVPLPVITFFARACGPYGAWLTCFERWFDDCSDDLIRARLCWAMAHMAENAGNLDKAMDVSLNAAELFLAHGEDREAAVMLGHIASILQARGEWDEALRIRREEILPVVSRLGDLEGRAVTLGSIADILQRQGELEEALRIRRESVLPAFEVLGDLRLRAVEMGRIADILQMRGELDEALRIRREKEIPVFELLGDVRERAITQGKIADILQARGEWDEALRIQREEELPVFERLEDVHALLVGRRNLAYTLYQRGRPEDRPEIHILLNQSLTEAERLRLHEAEAICVLIAQIFGDGEDSAPPP